MTLDLSTAALIERVEAASGPDRVLDALIKMRFDPHPSDHPEEIERIEDRGDELRLVLIKKHDKEGRPTHGFWGYHVSPPITRNLATVEAFVERHLPGCYWYLGKGKTRPSEALYGAQVLIKGVPTREEPEPDGIADHNASAALAFLLAALRALQVKEAGNG